MYRQQQLMMLLLIPASTLVYEETTDQWSTFEQNPSSLHASHGLAAYDMGVPGSGVPLNSKPVEKEIGGPPYAFHGDFLPKAR